MRVRDVLKKERRQLAAISASVFFATFTIPILLLHAGLALWAGLAAVGLFAAIAGVTVYRCTMSQRCPRCGTSLGQVAVRNFWWSPAHLDRCPICDLDLNREIETIQTI
jgi:hypothetical protein